MLNRQNLQPQKLHMKRFLGIVTIGALFGSLNTHAQDAAVTDGSDFEKLPFKISVDLRSGWDSNVNSASGNVVRDDRGNVVISDDEIDSAFSAFDITLSKTFGNLRSYLDLALSGGMTYYWDAPSDDEDYRLRLDATFRHAVNRRLVLSGNVGVNYQSEPDYYNSSVVSRGRRSGQYLYANSRVAANYQWTPKFSTATSYNLVGVAYEEHEVSHIEDRLEHYLSQEFRFLVLPTTTLVVEYRLGIINYEHFTDRDSIGHYALLGADHSFSSKFRGSVRAGVQFRDIDGGGDETSPHFEGNLTYAYAPDSTLTWTTRYGLEQSEIYGPTATNTTFRTGLVVRHGFTAKISGSLGAYYQNSDYENEFGNMNYTDDLIDLTASLSYQINRMFSLSTGYSYTDQSSDETFREFKRHRVWAGGTVSF